jgi:hypothetical protein
MPRVVEMDIDEDYDEDYDDDEESVHVTKPKAEKAKWTTAEVRFTHRISDSDCPGTELELLTHRHNRNPISDGRPLTHSLSHISIMVGS